jgi:hypothetical protein
MSPDMKIYLNNFHEAMSTPDKDTWWKAMCIKFENVEQKGVWQIVSKHNVPKKGRL